MIERITSLILFIDAILIAFGITYKSVLNSFCMEDNSFIAEIITLILVIIGMKFVDDTVIKTFFYSVAFPIGFVISMLIRKSNEKIEKHIREVNENLPR